MCVTECKCWRTPIRPLYKLAKPLLCRNLSPTVRVRKQRFFPPFLDLIIFCCSFYLPSRIVLSGGLKEWEVKKTRGVSDSKNWVCRASLSSVWSDSLQWHSGKLNMKLNLNHCLMNNGKTKLARFQPKWKSLTSPQSIIALVRLNLESFLLHLTTTFREVFDDL